MAFFFSMHQSTNFICPWIPSSITETAMAGVAVVSGLYSAAMGGAIGIGYLGYKGYQCFVSKKVYKFGVVEKRTFSNGDFYEGEFFQNAPHGKGKYIFSNGDIYVGDVVQNQLQGRGKLIFADGGWYEGDFVNGMFQGQGKWVYSDGTFYEGEFVQSKCQGKGKCAFADGGWYEGDFVDEQFHGLGKRVYFNEGFYEGEFIQGKIQGKGKYTFANGDFYEGDFVNERFHGRGKYGLADGWSYEGEFYNGAVVSTDISHLGDQLFYDLLNRPGNQGSNPGYNLGIMADYLNKKGYQDLSLSLSSAHQLLRISLNDMKKESNRIYNRLKQGFSQLCLYGCDGHSMGLNLVPEVSIKPESVICEIFNSGWGLSKYHERHNKDRRKYKTMLKIKVPLISLNPDKIKKIIFLNSFKNIKESYQYILKLSAFYEIIKSEASAWQTKQKGSECDLRWILAYLKSKMPIQKYKEMLSILRADCQEAYSKKKPHDSIRTILFRKRKRTSADVDQSENIPLKKNCRWQFSW